MQKVILHHGHVADFENKVNALLQEDYFVTPGSLKVSKTDDTPHFICEAILQKEANKIRVVKVGNDNTHATAEDIKDIQEQLLKVAIDPNTTIVTHHAVKVETLNA